MSDTSKCNCFKCYSERREQQAKETGGFFFMDRMIVCETCGNKRCPHATDHENQCTGSNEPGQVGSRFAKFNPDQP